MASLYKVTFEVEADSEDEALSEIAAKIEPSFIEVEEEDDG